MTDLARMGWELHAIATFAGHRHTDSTLTYIRLSSRDLADKPSRAWSRSTAGSLTWRFFGQEAVEETIAQVAATLQGWGYHPSNGALPSASSAPC
ncbi:hypothetical protein ACWEKM_22905 [Streptomyces sp. NPDC004752]